MSTVPLEYQASGSSRFWTVVSQACLFSLPLLSTFLLHCYPTLPWTLLASDLGTDFCPGLCLITICIKFEFGLYFKILFGFAYVFPATCRWLDIHCGELYVVFLADFCLEVFLQECGCHFSLLRLSLFMLVVCNAQSLCIYYECIQFDLYNIYLFGYLHKLPHHFCNVCVGFPL